MSVRSPPPSQYWIKQMFHTLRLWLHLEKPKWFLPGRKELANVHAAAALAAEAPFPPRTPSDSLLVYLNDTAVWNDGGFLSSWVMHSLSGILCLGTFSTSLITNCNKVTLFCNSIAFVKKSQSCVRMWKGTVIYHMPCLTPYYKISFLVPEIHIHVLFIAVPHG